MLRTTEIRARYVHFTAPSTRLPLSRAPIRNMFPLIYSNHLLNKTRRRLSDYKGQQAFDEDHPLPVRPMRSTELSKVQKFFEHDYRVNPQLIQSHKDLLPTSEYIGPRAGVYYPGSGWHRVGGNWKESGNYKILRKGIRRSEWQERHITPRFLLAPRVCPGGPQTRHEGILRYHPVSLARILWFVDAGHLNPNEVITVKALVDSGVVRENVVFWPGLRLVAGGLKGPLKGPPLNLELQRGSDEAIKLVEGGGGSFTATYYSPEGFHQELHPEEYPTFVDQPMPERHALEEVSGVPQERGYLARWAEESAQYAHPDSGRRHAHYVQPPTDRDFPSTSDEYEQVKHHQKWHLQQPGTGTILPWQFMNTLDLHRTPVKKLQ